MKHITRAVALMLACAASFAHAQSVQYAGGKATFDFAITDSSPVDLFYLLQEQLDQVAGDPRRQVAVRP